MMGHMMKNPSNIKFWKFHAGLQDINYIPPPSQLTVSNETKSTYEQYLNKILLQNVTPGWTKQVIMLGIEVKVET